MMALCCTYNIRVLTTKYRSREISFGQARNMVNGSFANAFV